VRGPIAVTLIKGDGRRYRTLFERRDGVQVEMEGGPYNQVGGPHAEIPHDLAHLVVESELGLDGGVFGVLAKGGLFRLARVSGGRRPPHDRERAAAVVKAFGEELNQAEVLVAAVCALVAEAPAHLDPGRIRRDAGERWWTDAVTRAALDRIRSRLLQGAGDWARLPAGAELALAWEER
jgi:hypothetical protein